MIKFFESNLFSFLLIGFLLLGNISFAHAQGDLDNPRCQKLQRLQRRLTPLLEFRPAPRDNCEPNVPDAEYLAESLARITFLQTLSYFTTRILARFTSAFFLALRPTELGNGTLSARYTGSAVALTLLLTDPPSMGCRALLSGGNGARRLNEFLDMADGHYTTQRIQCEVGRMQEAFEATLRPQVVRPDATNVNLPNFPENC